eukprot:7999907-Ditylum_brightwellii.AAC.2
MANKVIDKPIKQFKTCQLHQAESDWKALDLYASEKDNSSIDNYTTVDTFGDTMSKGKTNDHIFHNICLTYAIQFYVDERKHKGKDAIPFNIIQTDNCGSQCKWCQTFLEVTSSCNTRDTTVVHKYAQKDWFKGSWDATGKHAKHTINCLKLKYDLVANTNDCCHKLGCEMSKEGTHEEAQKMLEYEREVNIKVLENEILKTR